MKNIKIFDYISEAMSVVYSDGSIKKINWDKVFTPKDDYYENYTIVASVIIEPYLFIKNTTPEIQDQFDNFFKTNDWHEVLISNIETFATYDIEKWKKLIKFIKVEGY